jgi:hypothetical protein
MLSVHDAPVRAARGSVTFNSRLFLDVVRQQFATSLELTCAERNGLGRRPDPASHLIRHRMDEVLRSKEELRGRAPYQI